MLSSSLQQYKLFSYYYMSTILPAFILLHLAVPAGLLWNLENDIIQTSSVLPCIIISLGAFMVSYQLIPSVSVMTAGAGLSGRDLNKRNGGIM